MGVVLKENRVLGYVLLTVRLPVLALWTVGMLCLRVVVAPTAAFAPKMDQRWRRFILKTWARAAGFMFGMRLTVQGTPPERPFFLVANHLSYIDGIVLASQLGGVFVAKSEVASWPLLGFAAKRMNTIFIVRQKRADTVRVNEAIARAMELGNGVIMFAESTTSRGLEVRPFKTALFEAVVQNECPVHYVSIHYNTPPGTPPASDWVCWWTPEPPGLPPSFFGHILRLLRRPYFNAVLTFGEKPISGTDRKALAQELHDAVQKQFIPCE